MEIKYRLIKKNEYPFLEEMLYEAIFVPIGKPNYPKSIIQNPDLKKYVDLWSQKKDDIAVVALDGDKLIGAIWGRKFQSDKKGYGFIDEHIPEISMAVKEEYRGKGIGTALIDQIENRFSEMGIFNLSLSVDRLNPAKKLYERCGYKLYEEQETTITMIKEIEKPAENNV